MPALTRLTRGYLWQQACGAMAGRDNRVLLISPSAASGLGGVTDLAKTVLQQFGFEVWTADEGGSAEDELDFAFGFELILCLVATVGTASETLLLLNGFTSLSADALDPVKIPRLNVISPSAYRNTHFARTVEGKFSASTYFCCPLDPTDPEYSDDELACKILEALGASVRARAGGGMFRQEAAKAQERLDDQRRRAIVPVEAPTPQTVSSEPLDTKPALIFLGGVAGLSVLLVGGDALPLYVGVPVFLISMVLLVIVLFHSKLEGNQVADLLMEILRKIPMIGGGQSPPELGPGTGEVGDPPNESG